MPAMPLPKVSGPRYYTYKPDAMRFVNIAKFAEPTVTGAIASASGEAAMAPVVVERQFLAEAKVRADVNVAKALEAYYGSSRTPLSG
ncbi:hypothetical protein AJ87_30670 [Rhizobium yanglingense]|nr:hypothetical protein AJ87_30670 [Rhizobium yanglingense]